MIMIFCLDNKKISLFVSFVNCLVSTIGMRIQDWIRSLCFTHFLYFTAGFTYQPFKKPKINACSQICTVCSDKGEHSTHLHVGTGTTTSNTTYGSKNIMPSVCKTSSYNRSMSATNQTNDLNIGGINEPLQLKPCHVANATPMFISEYNQYLRDFYMRITTECRLYPSLSVSEFINLLIVKVRVEERRRIMKYKACGRIDLIKCERKVALIEEIGSGLHQQCYVLIEGDPGVGKSTLVLEMSKRWAEGQLLQRWDILILVQLKYIDVRKANNLDYIIDPLGEYPEISQHIIDVLGEGLLLIVDGFDELSDKQRENASVIMRLLNGDILSKASIIVTSRPTSTRVFPEKFLQKKNQHFEIIGFEHQDIEKYIECKFKDSKHSGGCLDAFNSYTLNHNFLFSTMRVPFHCMMVTGLYDQYWKKRNKQFSLKTLTNLYSCFICYLLECYLNNVPRYKGLKIDSIGELPEEVYYQFMVLAELAARGIENKEYVFIDVRCETLGLLHSLSDHCNQDENNTVFYSFSHLTVQEYLAAYYWSKQSENNFSSLLEQDGLLPVKCFINECHEISHWPALAFYAGLTGISGSALESIIRSNRSTNYNYLWLLFEGQNADLNASVFNDCEVLAFIKSSLGAYVLGYCLAQSDRSGKWQLEIESRFMKNLVFGIHRAKLKSKGGCICRLVVTGSSDCGIFRLLSILGEIKQFVHNLDLKYTTKEEDTEVFKLSNHFVLDNFVYKAYWEQSEESIIFLLTLLESLTMFKNLRKVSLYTHFFTSRLISGLDRLSVTLRDEKTLFPSTISTCSFTVQHITTYKKLFWKYINSEFEYTLCTPYGCCMYMYQNFWHFVDSNAEKISHGKLTDDIQLNMTIIPQEHQWLLGPEYSNLHWFDPCTASSGVLSLSEDTSTPNHLRVITSPDCVRLLTDQFKCGIVKLSSLNLYGFSGNELITTVIQSARECNPGLIVKTLKIALILDIDCNENYNSGFAESSSYKICIATNTVQHRLCIKGNYTYISYFLNQCLLFQKPLRIVEVENCVLSLESLCRLLQENYLFDWLVLYSLFCNDEASMISSGLERNQGLKSVSLRVCGKESCSTILKGLTYHETIELLIITNCVMIVQETDYRTVQHLINVIKCAKQLRQIILYKCCLDSKSLMSIISAAAKRNLRELDVYDKVDIDHRFDGFELDVNMLNSSSIKLVMNFGYDQYYKFPSLRANCLFIMGTDECK